MSCAAPISVANGSPSSVLADDAIANAIGSNIFDICFALGFPLFLYGLIHGDVNMVSAGDGQELGEGRQDAAEIQSLRVLLIIMSAIIMGLFVVTKCEVDDMGRPVHLVTVVRPNTSQTTCSSCIAVLACEDIGNKTERRRLAIPESETTVFCAGAGPRVCADFHLRALDRSDHSARHARHPVV